MDLLLAALHKTGLEAKGGITGLASRLVVQQKTLINKLNPHDEASEPKISEFVRIMKDTGDTTPLDELCRMFDGKFTTKTHVKAQSLVHAVLCAGSKHGSAMQSIEEAIVDDVIDDDELFVVVNALRDAAQALEVLMNTAKHEHRAK